MSDRSPDLEGIFTYHPPKKGQPAQYQRIREQAKRFAQLVVAEAPDSEERVVAIRRIEEAVMWANAAIARHGEGEQ